MLHQIRDQDWKIFCLVFVASFVLLIITGVVTYPKKNKKGAINKGKIFKLALLVAFMSTGLSWGSHWLINNKPSPRSTKKYYDDNDEDDDYYRSHRRSSRRRTEPEYEEREKSKYDEEPRRSRYEEREKTKYEDEYD